MKLSSVIVQGGLAARAGEDYGEQQDQRNFNTKTRALGIRKMDAEGQLLDQQTDLQRLRNDVEQNELAFKKDLQPTLQSTARSAANVQNSEARTAEKNAPGAAMVSTATQQQQVADLREKQAASIWQMVKMGDTKGAVEAMSNSEILHPGRKFKDIVRGQVPVHGADGQPMIGADGKPVTEPTAALVPADGGDPIFIPEKQLDSLLTKHNTQVVKAGNNIVRVGPNGATPLYEASEANANPEDGSIFFHKGPKAGTTVPPAAAGVNPGAPKPAPGGKATARVDERVKMAIDKVILPKYGGRFEGGMFFPDEANKTVATRATALAGEYVRGGMDPEAAGAKAIEAAEREKALGAAGGGTGGGGGYDGPTPWKQ